MAEENVGRSSKDNVHNSSNSQENAKTEDNTPQSVENAEIVESTFKTSTFENPGNDSGLTEQKSRTESKDEEGAKSSREESEELAVTENTSGSTAAENREKTSDKTRAKIVRKDDEDASDVALDGRSKNEKTLFGASENQQLDSEEKKSSLETNVSGEINGEIGNNTVDGQETLKVSGTGKKSEVPDVEGKVLKKAMEDDRGRTSGGVDKQEDEGDQVGTPMDMLGSKKEESNAGAQNKEVVGKTRDDDVSLKIESRANADDEKTGSEEDEVETAGGNVKDQSNSERGKLFLNDGKGGEPEQHVDNLGNVRKENKEHVGTSGINEAIEKLMDSTDDNGGVSPLKVAEDGVEDEVSKGKSDRDKEENFFCVIAEEENTHGASEKDKHAEEKEDISVNSQIIANGDLDDMVNEILSATDDVVTPQKLATSIVNGDSAARHDESAKPEDLKESGKPNIISESEKVEILQESEKPRDSEHLRKSETGTEFVKPESLNETEKRETVKAVEERVNVENEPSREDNVEGFEGTKNGLGSGTIYRVQTDFLTRQVLAKQEREAYLEEKLAETTRDLEVAERKVKDLQLRLKRFVKDDEAKDNRMRQMEREYKELANQMQRIEESLDLRGKNNNIGEGQNGAADKERERKRSRSRVCVVL